MDPFVRRSWQANSPDIFSMRVMKLWIGKGTDEMDTAATTTELVKQMGLCRNGLQKGAVARFLDAPVREIRAIANGPPIIDAPANCWLRITDEFFL